MKKATKYLVSAILITIITVVLSIFVAFTLDEVNVIIRLTLAMTNIATFTNLIIVALNYRSMFMLINAEDKLHDADAMYRELVGNLEDAGITARKLKKFEPMVDELSYVVENLDPDKLGNAMEALVDILNEMNGDYGERLANHPSLSEYEEENIFEKENDIQ